MAATATGHRLRFPSSSVAVANVRLISCDTFWNNLDGRRCTLEIFCSRGFGNIARVKQFAEELQSDGTILSNEMQEPVTCRLPDDSKEYMLEFIQNFTENKISNGYTHLASTPDPELPDISEQEQLQQALPPVVDAEANTAHLPDPPLFRDASGTSPSPQGVQPRQVPSSDENMDDHSTQRHKKSVGSFDVNEVSKYFHLPIHEAAAKLSVGETWLKQKCRDSGIRRWPYRKVKSMDKIIQRLQVQMKEGALSLSDSQLQHLREQLREAEEKRRQICLDALSGALEDAGCGVNTANESPEMHPNLPTPESSSALTPFSDLPVLKRIKTECARSPRSSSPLQNHFTPKTSNLGTPPKPMHNSFPGLLDGNLEGFLSSPAALRLASAVTPNRAALLTPHFLGSPLKFNPDFNFA